MMADDPDISLTFVLELLMTGLIERRKNTREEVITALSLVLSTVIAPIPSRERRQAIVKHITVALSEDVEDLVEDQRR